MTTITVQRRPARAGPALDGGLAAVLGGVVAAMAAAVAGGYWLLADVRAAVGWLAAGTAGLGVAAALAGLAAAWAWRRARRLGASAASRAGAIVAADGRAFALWFAAHGLA